MAIPITYENVTDACRAQASGIEALANRYDALVAFGERARKAEAKMKKSFTDRAGRVLGKLEGIIKPAVQASFGTLGKIGLGLFEWGKGAVKSMYDLAERHAASQEYVQAQDMYRTYSGKETEDRKARVNADTEAETASFPKRTAIWIRNTLKNAEEQEKLARMAGELTRAGIFSTPLGAYALSKGDAKTYLKTLPRKERKDPWTTLDINGRTYRFEKPEQFTDFMSGILNIAQQRAYQEAAENFYARANTAQQAQDPESRQERNITSKVYVSGSPYSRVIRGLLTP